MSVTRETQMNAQAIVFLVGALLNMGGNGQAAKASSIQAPHACHVKFVSFAFSGKPGTPITYHGETYIIPESGSIELIAQRNDFAFEAAGYRLQVSDQTQRDEFGSGHVAVEELIAGVMLQRPATVQLAEATPLSVQQ